MKTKLIVAYATYHNDEFIKKFNKEIKSSIGRVEHEIIPYKNLSGRSLTEIYNDVWAQFNETENIIVFIHHDVHFKSKDWGKNLLNTFNNNNIDVIGLAGTDKFYSNGTWWLDGQGSFNKYDLWGKVWHTDGKKEWKTDFSTPYKKCEKVQPVVAVDGVFIAINPRTCLSFDEDFAGFHFYDVSFCVRNFLAGKKIGVTETIQIVHESGGKLDANWEASRQLLLEKYEFSKSLEVNK